MDKLKTTIEQYGRWSELAIYIERIEAHIATDFSHALENAKALLETIAKEICKSKCIDLESSGSINNALKKAFSAIGYSGDDLVTQVSSSLANIGKQMGNLRNDIGVTSHGMTLDELKERNNKVDNFTKEFLIDSTVIVACFLIKAFENNNPRVIAVKESSIKPKLLYEENDDFNESWDISFGEFDMGDYSYTASEILYNVDYKAYETEQMAFALDTAE
ncbi:MAG TPA: hypothetical protein DF296_06290 [Candidatus Margulisbacteria bacterium]|nr:hypothetical protein [Candidatus Margulisiibacteriota bacterium]